MSTSTEIDRVIEGFYCIGTAVVACAKICSDVMAKTGITMKRIFHWFELWWKRHQWNGPRHQITAQHIEFWTFYLNETSILYIFAVKKDYHPLKWTSVSIRKIPCLSFNMALVVVIPWPTMLDISTTSRSGEVSTLLLHFKSAERQTHCSRHPSKWSQCHVNMKPQGN